MNELTRRGFLSASAGAAAVVAGLSLAGAFRFTRNPEKKLKLLILGGTGFLGPHIVRIALERGHEMTLFNRGRTNTHLFPELEKLQGDRDGQLDALKGDRTWDAVIDTSAYYPRAVHLTAGLLADRISQYLVISTISVYRDYKQPGMDETYPVGTIADPTTEQVTGVTFGPLKALCERAAEKEMPGRSTAIRPGLIVGPGDPTDRFTYWPSRVSQGGEVLAPGEPTHPVQFIDVRDLAAFIVHCLETSAVGTFNADRKPGSTTIGGLLETCKAESKSDATFTWADMQTLSTHGVAPWSHMPCWVPPVGDYAGFGQVSVDRALAAGLTTRPIAETVRDTLEWIKTLPEDRRSQLESRQRAGLAPDKEKQVLDALRSAKG